MLLEDPTRRYPYLVQALNVLGRRRFDVPQDRDSARLLFFIACISGGFALATGAAVMLWMAILCGVGSLVTVIRRRTNRRPPIQIDPRAREATAIAQTMSQMLHKRRLHRDLDEGSLTLLEECSRHWIRARTALEGPYWTTGTVPIHYQSFRVQALTSLDEAMDEVLIHYRAWVPDEVQNRHALDYVDEALEQFTIKGGRRGSHVPPQFYPVREIAEKLRSLADEAEELSRQARIDPEVAAQFAPGRTLDQTLSELRQIRAAEDELRQNLRS